MKLRILAMLLAILSIFSVLTLSGCSGSGEAVETEEAEKPKEETKVQHTKIDFYGVDWINAQEFGFIGDGATPNDQKMAEYIKYYSATPIYFSQGIYCFEKTINFPDTMHIKLDPKAELRCTAKEPLECFISLRAEVKDWCVFTKYAHQSYIQGGIINANNKAKIGIGVSQGYHTQFADFMIMNVLEKGIQTNYNTAEFHDGASVWNNIVIYNEHCRPGTYGVYDNYVDSNFTKVDVTNFETAYYTHGGRFYECSSWNLDMNAVKNSTYAYIAKGNQSLFVNCSVDTYRYGFKLAKDASVAVNNATWITNSVFYTEQIQKQYPRTVFYAEDPNSAQFYVVGLQLPWESHLAFSNAELRKSVFMNIRYPAGTQGIANLRNDTSVITNLVFQAQDQEIPETTSLNGNTDFDSIKIPYTYDCEMRVGKNGNNAPPVKETGILEVAKIGTKVVQRFTGLTTCAQRIFDGAKWGQWIVTSN